MKQLIVLIGLPASGKSTYFNEHLKKNVMEGKILSRDMIVEWFAKQNNCDYNLAFNTYAKEIDKVYRMHMEDAKKFLPDYLVVDKTNLYSHVRDREYQFFLDKGYCITYIFFTKPVDEEFAEWKNRLSSRPGKTIPPHVLENMYNDYLEDVPSDAKVQPHFKFWVNNWKGVRDG